MGQNQPVYHQKPLEWAFYSLPLVPDPETTDSSKCLLDLVQEELARNPNVYDSERRLAKLRIPASGELEMPATTYLQSLRKALIEQGARRGLEVEVLNNARQEDRSTWEVELADEKDPTKLYQFRLDYYMDERGCPIPSLHRKRYVSGCVIRSREPDDCAVDIYLTVKEKPADFKTGTALDDDNPGFWSKLKDFWSDIKTVWH